MLFGNKKERARANAEKLIAQGKYAAAVGEYETIVQSDPSDMMAVNTLGDLYTRVGKLDEAIHNFSRIAESYRESGFTLKAIAMYKKISKLKPGSLDICEKLAGLYTQQGLMVEARKQYLVLAENYLEERNTKAAYPVYKRIVDLEPDNYEVRIKLAELCVENGDARQAHDAFLQAGQELFRRGLFQESVEVFRRALELFPASVPAINAATRVYVQVGQIDKAVALLDAAFATDPDNQQLKMILATVYLTAGMLAEAEETLLGLVGADPTKYEIFLELGRKCLEKNMLDMAAQQVGNAIEHLLNYRTEDKGIALLHEVLKRDHNHVPSIERLIEIYTRTGDIHSLISTLDWCSEAAIKKGDRDRAIEALKRLIEIDYNNLDYIHRLESLGVDLSSPGSRPSTPPPDQIVVPGSDLETLDDDFEFADQEELSDADSLDSTTLETELQNVDFFIAQGFIDIAQDNIERLKTHFGESAEIRERQKRCSAFQEEAEEIPSQPPVEIVENDSPAPVASQKNEIVAEQFVPYTRGATLLSEFLIPSKEESSCPGAESADAATSFVDVKSGDGGAQDSGFAFTFAEETRVEWPRGKAEVVDVDDKLFRGRGEDDRNTFGRCFESTAPVEIGTTQNEPEDAAGEEMESLTGAGFSFSFAPVQEEKRDEGNADADARAESAGGSGGDLETLEIDLEELGLSGVFATGYGSEASSPQDAAPIEPMAEPPRISMRPVNRAPSIVPAKAPPRETTAAANGDRTYDIKCVDPISTHPGILRIQTSDAPSDLFNFNPTEEASTKGIDPSLAEVYEQAKESLGTAGNKDFETAYQLGLAYKEMELWDIAIKEFQTAIRLTSPEDPAGRYLQCCAMLGSCFLGKGHPRPAIKWLEKGLDAPNRNEDEYQALRFDLGTAYEMMGDVPMAYSTFQEVYAIDVEYRDVGSRISELESRRHVM